MKPARPPSPEYFRTFVARWCGHLDRPIVVVDGNGSPHGGADGDRMVIFVGRDWLKRQAIKPEDLT